MSVLRVPKNRLVLIAGLVWCVAGAMVSIIGLPLEVALAPAHVVIVPLALAVFVTFYAAVFSRLVVKHSRRIHAHPDDRLAVWTFFDRPSWVVMAVMMGGGMAIRASHVAPDWMIAFFYSGLGVALFLCGVRFVAISAREAVTA